MPRCRLLAASFLWLLLSHDLLHFRDDLSGSITASNRVLVRLFTIGRDSMVEERGLLERFKAIGIRGQRHLQAFLDLGKITVFRTLQFYRLIDKFERLDPVG